MTPVWFVVYVLFAHWVADFVCQTRWMANNKSKCLLALNLHVLTYSGVLGLFLWPVWANELIVVPGGKVVAYVVINMLFHWLTDSLTSRLTTKFWQDQKVKAFFTTIGFDQFIHVATLILTAKLVFRLPF